MCRNQKGSLKDGCPITGIDFVTNKNRETLVLITTKDNSLRMFSLDDFAYRHKYKGAYTDSLSIKAYFHQTGSHIICPSSTGDVYMNLFKIALFGELTMI